MVSPEAMLPPEPLHVATITLVPAISIRHEVDASWESGFFIIAGALFIAAAIMLILEHRRLILERRRYRVSRVAIRRFGAQMIAEQVLPILHSAAGE